MKEKKEKKEKSNTSPARGMRDILSVDVRRRDYVMSIIKETYQKYGFEPLETPAIENLETLMGKYGDEGNQLIFKILKRGEKLDQELAKFNELTESTELANSEHSENSENSKSSGNSLADLALRYDLTVPLARVAANRSSELPKFYRRYQIQPVWRADKPGRGRFREFYQCDIDAIGSGSMLVETDVFSAVAEVLKNLGFKEFVIKLNHRQVLRGILEAAGIEEARQTDALVALDKLDKIGTDGVVGEMLKRGISEASINKVLELFKKINSLSENAEILDALKDFVGENQFGQLGCKDLGEILGFAKDLPIKIDASLARGLSYYTGAIMEVDVGKEIGSLGGGGRYDGLIGMFGKEQIPACGFSLGLERILVVMEERGMFPPEIAAVNSADVMVTIWNEESVADSLALAQELRAQGLHVLLYPEADKMGKQFKYAGQINVPYVVVQGDDEKAAGMIALKNMQSGEQETVKREDIAKRIKAA